MFEWGWQQGSATVVARRLVKEFRTSAGGEGRSMKRRKFEFILDVRPPDGSQRFRATCENSSFDPVQGDQVWVKFKPKSQKVKFDSRRMLGHTGPRKPQPEDDRWRDMLDDEPGTPPPPR